MKRPRRGRRRKGGKHLTISARNAEWEEARAKADRRGLSLSGYVRMLLDRDVSGEEKTFTALAPEEQRELLEGVRELRALRALLTEEAAAPARDEETAREPPAPPARVEETGREPPARARRRTGVRRRVPIRWSRTSPSRARADCRSEGREAWSPRSTSSSPPPSR